MRIYRVVKKEENPTIALSKVSLNNGFIIVTSDGEAIGIIVHDLNSENYFFITDFSDYFGDFDSDSGCSNLEALMNCIKKDYDDPVEFNFVKVEQ